MTRDEVIEKMQEAGLKAPVRGEFIFIHWDQISLLLDHERAAEREACLQIVVREASQYSDPVWAVEIVNDIRERGQQ